MAEVICYYPMDDALTFCGRLADGATTKDRREGTCREGCLEIGADDLARADVPFQGRCLQCRGIISAVGGVDWAGWCVPSIPTAEQIIRRRCLPGRLSRQAPYHSRRLQNRVRQLRDNAPLRCLAALDLGSQGVAPHQSRATREANRVDPEAQQAWKEKKAANDQASQLREMLANDPV